MPVRPTVVYDLMHWLRCRVTDLSELSTRLHGQDGQVPTELVRLKQAIATCLTSIREISSEIDVLMKLDLDSIKQESIESLSEDEISILCAGARQGSCRLSHAANG